MTWKPVVSGRKADEPMAFADAQRTLAGSYPMVCLVWPWQRCCMKRSKELSRARELGAGGVMVIAHIEEYVADRSGICAPRVI